MCSAKKEREREKKEKFERILETGFLASYLVKERREKKRERIVNAIYQLAVNSLKHVQRSLCLIFAAERGEISIGKRSARLGVREKNLCWIVLFNKSCRWSLFYRNYGGYLEPVPRGGSGKRGGEGWLQVYAAVCGQHYPPKRCQHLP